MDADVVMGVDGTVGCFDGERALGGPRARRRGRELARKVATALVGGALIALGGVMLFLPAPGSLVLLLGFSVLAREFVWASRVRSAVQRSLRALAFSLLALVREGFRRLGGPVDVRRWLALATSGRLVHAVA